MPIYFASNADGVVDSEKRINPEILEKNVTTVA